MNPTPHRRYNPLLRQWILVSPQRATRPWQGSVEPPPAAAAASYDPACYLCPGNQRHGGASNPAYNGTFVFDNDFPALDAGTARDGGPRHRLLRREPETGACRVVCYSPRHDLALPALPPAAVAGLVDVWTEEYAELARRRGIGAVTIFENRGAMMGASNPHPHGQIWANRHVPNELARESAALAAAQRASGTCLLCDYLKLELQQRVRLVCENDSFVVVTPYWAYWPFETLLLSRAHVGALDGLRERGRAELADILRRLMARYDNLFRSPFPCAWGFHQRGVHARGSAGTRPEWHLHAHFYPPLLRSASIRKFLGAYEMLAMPQRDGLPEDAAERLRTCADQ